LVKWSLKYSPALRTDLLHWVPDCLLGLTEHLLARA
jgi:hypothetical protein